MNILQVLPELRSGGVERGTVDLAKHLKKSGHKAVVVSAGGALVGELTAAGVTHYALPVHRKSPMAVIHSIRALDKIVRLENIDVIHARSRIPALIAFFVSRRTQVPFITTCHGFYSKHFLSRMMGWGKLVIVASHIIGRRMREDFGVPHDKLRLIPRGVDLEQFQLRPQAAKDPSRPIVVGMVGRLTPIKGHSLFLKAMARVARVMPNVQVKIVGDAPKVQYKEDLQALTRQLGLSDAVQFMGTRYDIPELISGFDLLVAPSVGEEAFGRVVIEAGACGVPVIATRMGGLVDIIDHEKEGLLVPPDDPRVLAEAVLRILKDPEFASGLARSLRKKVVKEFTLDLMFERTLKVYEEAIAQKKILVIKLSALGDVILSIPSLRALRKRFPESKISVLVGRRSRKIVRNCPYVDDVLVYDEPKSGKLFSRIGMAKLLAKEGFDIVVDLQNNRVSHFLAYFSGARVRAGHGNGKASFFLNRRTRDIGSLPPLEHQFEVLKLIGVETAEKSLELWTEKSEDQAVERFLASQWVAPSQLLVGINPGSSVRWPTKQWPVENFARLCDELARRNIRVVITGSEEEAGVAEELLKLTKNRPVNAVGKTSITELVALTRRCQVFISSDSAPMHIASALQIPLIAIFGPTDPRRHLVPPPQVQVFWKEVACSPCYLRTCHVGHICMKKIPMQEVLDSVLGFIHANRNAGPGRTPQNAPASAGTGPS